MTLEEPIITEKASFLLNELLLAEKRNFAEQFSTGMYDAKVSYLVEIVVAS